MADLFRSEHTLNHALHLSLNYLSHQVSIYKNEENNPPAFPSTALYHQGENDHLICEDEGVYM